MAALRKAFRHRDRPELAGCCQLGLMTEELPVRTGTDGAFNRSLQHFNL